MPNTPVFSDEENADDFRRLRAGASDVLSRKLAALRPQLQQRAADMLPVSLRSRLDPDDVVQDAIARVVSNLAQFHGNSDREFASWTLTTVERAVTNMIRRHMGPTRSVAVEEATTSGANISVTGKRPRGKTITTPSQAAVRAEAAKIIDARIAELPAEMQDVIDLHYRQGLTIKQIAELKSQTEQRIYRLRTRALEQLADLRQRLAR